MNNRVVRITRRTRQDTLWKTAAPQIYTWRRWTGTIPILGIQRWARITCQARTRIVSGLAPLDTILTAWLHQDPHLSLVLFIRYRCSPMYRWRALLPSSTQTWFKGCWHKVSSPSSLDLLLFKQVYSHNTLTLPNSKACLLPCLDNSCTL